MDKFVTVIKPARSSLCTNSSRFTPYPTSKPKTNKNFPDADVISKSNYPEAVAKDKARLRQLLGPLKQDGASKPSACKITKHLLNTLADESNPITHSNIYERSDHVVSAASGHQRSDRRGGGHRRGYLDERSMKLEVQKHENARDLHPVKRDETEGKRGVLSGVRVYIGGYLAGTTDIEMKRIVAGAGGITLLSPSGATHILTSQQLSGSKTHKHLVSKRNPAHVVRPEWVFESVRAGRRLREWEFTATKPESTMDLAKMFGKKKEL
ncbi:hypothetical protein DEU56DRAFT_765963 [Suillus clintonianus]|uniref:uncharacterized protein n=1 Tax=Suillus clintonianus TaxID=1904413 RepID=UPI001B882A9C|nr:uncharacterized protein DEU56DRAFT_765963 [Suillus clintonianus]KAG2156191.1 hypothetical protein DEU56DRAFT_765963 [Suillus clintonianus]